MTDDEKVKAAKKAMLDEINKHRIKAGFTELKRISPLYWKLYGEEWLKKVKGA